MYLENLPVARLPPSAQQLAALLPAVIPNGHSRLPIFPRSPESGAFNRALAILGMDQLIDVILQFPCPNLKGRILRIYSISWEEHFAQLAFNVRQGTEVPSSGGASMGIMRRAFLCMRADIASLQGNPRWCPARLAHYTRYVTRLESYIDTLDRRMAIRNQCLLLCKNAIFTT